MFTTKETTRAEYLAWYSALIFGAQNVFSGQHIFQLKTGGYETENYSMSCLYIGRVIFLIIFASELSKQYSIYCLII